MVSRPTVTYDTRGRLYEIAEAIEESEPGESRSFEQSLIIVLDAFEDGESEEPDSDQDEDQDEPVGGGFVVGDVAGGRSSDQLGTGGGRSTDSFPRG